MPLRATYAAVLVALVASLLGGPISVLPVPPAHAAPGESCFTVSDGNDTLYRYNYDGGPVYETIGAVGVPRIEAISWDPVNSVLYAMDAGQLGTLNQTTGVFSPIGADSGLDMDGLGLDPFTGVMYGAIRRADGQSGGSGVYDDLATVDIGTGAVTVVGPISGAVDDSSNALFDVDDLAFDPTTGSLWGVANAGGNDTLIVINKFTGSVMQSVGEFGVNDMEGLSWNDIGGLRGTTGSGGSSPNDLWDINPSTAVAGNPIPLSPGSDFESLGCYRVAGPLSNTITGTVYLDADVNAAFGAGDTGSAGHTVNLYRDVNGDGMLTSADDVTFDAILDANDILDSRTTDGSGFYSFTVGATGAFMTEVATTTLPAGSRLTTPGLRAIDFGTSWDQTDADNDFGYSIPDATLSKATSTPVIDSGDTASYLYQVENTGTEPFPLANVALVDDSCAAVAGPTSGDTNTNNVLDPGETWTYGCSTSLTQDTINTATATVTPVTGPNLVETDTAFVDVRPSIVVTKAEGVATIAEPGGTVTFDIAVQNTSLESVDLTTLTDSVFGNLFTATNTTCGTTAIAPAATYNCSFDGTVTGDASGPDHSNTATAIAEDDEGNTATDNDDATVTFTDALPSVNVTKTPGVASIAEPGGTVNFTIDVENTSNEPVDLTSLTDSDFGNLFAATNTTCATTTIAPAATYTCTFEGVVTGDASGPDHANTATGSVEDNEGNSAADNDGAAVTFTDVAPTIAVTKTALPTTVPAAGAPVTFTVRVDNSSVEPVTLTSLTDSIYADVADLLNPAITGTTCSLPQGIAASGFYQCSFTATVSGPAGGFEVDTVTATGEDNEGNPTIDTDDATVTFADGSIGDFVWLDLDGDGVQDGGPETSIAGVDVELYVDVDSSGTVTAADTLVGTETTDGVGAYDFTGLAADDYVVVPDAGGLLGTFALTGGSNPLVVSLGAGEDFDGADFGYQPTGSVGDVVWLDLDGDGVEDGAAEMGLVGVTVDLYEDLDSSGTVTAADTLVGTATTDGSGTYDFQSLLPGLYVVTVTDTGAVIPPSTLTGGSDPTAVSLSPGEDFDGADFGYQPTGSVGDVVWLDLDGDGVEDGGAEVGLVGVTVDLYEDLDSSGTVTAGDNLVGTETTDGGGAYDFISLVPGNYVVAVTDTGGVIPPSNLTGGSDPASVSLAAGEDFDGADFGYQPFVTIGDRVWLDVDGDGVQDPGEATGLAGVTVNLVDPGPDTTPGTLDDIVVDTALTGGSGDFVLTGPAGTYVVQFAGLPAGYVLSQPDQGGDDTADSDPNPASGFTAAVSLPGAGSDLSIDAGAYQPALIGDRVFIDLDLDGGFDPGEGIPNITVTLSDGQTTVTDADGFYQFAAVAGSYAVTVDEVDVDFPASALLTVGTNPAATSAVAGETVDTVDFGYIIAGPGILMTKDPASQTVLTGSDATFTITVTNIGNVALTGVNVSDALAPACDASLGILLPAESVSYPCDLAGVAADFTNTATATGTPPIGTDVSSIDSAVVDVVDPGVTIAKDPATQTIPVGTNATFTITVTNTGDSHLTGVTVGDPLTPSCDLVIGGLAVGATVTHSCDAPAVTDDFTNTATVTSVGPLGPLPPVSDTADVFVDEATLAGRVWLDLDGDAVQDVGEPGAGGVLVELRDSGGTVVAVLSTDGSGDYLFTGLPADDYTVRVDPSGLPLGTVQTADPDGTLDDQTPQSVALGDAITGLDFGYRPPATVAGVVFVDDNGNAILDEGELPLPRVTVLVTDVTGAPVSVVTDSAGGYSAAVLPGAVTVDVEDATVPADHLLTTSNDPQGVVAVAGVIASASDIGYQAVTVDLMLTKVSSEGNVQAGDDAEWILTVTNVGGADAAGTITVTDDLPAGLEYVSAGGAGWTCTESAALVACTHPGPLVSGGALEVRILTTVDAALSGTLSNTAEVSMVGDANILNNTGVAGIGLLPNTGFALSDVVGWAAMSLALGAGLLVLARRRKEPAP